MDRVGRRVPVIAKLEKPEAIDNLEAIVLAFDAGKRLREPDEIAWGTFARYSELFHSNMKELGPSQDPVVLGAGSYLVVL